MESRLYASTSNRLIDAFIKAEDASNGRVGYSAYGPCLTSALPNGVHLNFTVDPYIYFGSEIQNPQDIETFTVRFVAYTAKQTPEGLVAVHLTNEELDTLLEPMDSKLRRQCDATKELNGLALVLSGKEYFQAESFACERERQVYEEACRQSRGQEEGGIDGPSLCCY